MNRKLVIVGNGKMREALSRRAGADGNIIFTGRVSDDELRGIYANAKALIFPGIEDFGIVPVEAQAAGTPVIALGKGGALETVRNRETGIFFNDASVQSLCIAIETFESLKWNPELCRKNSRNFTYEEFIAKMKRVLL